MTFASIGQDVIIWPEAKIASPDRIVIGNAVIIDDFVLLIGGEQTRIGDFVHIGAFTSIAGGGEFIMEDFSGVSGGVRIYTGNEDYSGACMTNPTVPAPFREPIRSFVRIRRHAIIGANSVILPGVTIGEGAVVAAGSLVTRDCKAWTTYRGSPARRQGERPSETILRLEADLCKTAYDAHGQYIAKSDRAARVP
jgi:acetyltransferase-like isoleucine patch superfamily enzyme